jgi:hypothetical protein
MKGLLTTGCWEKTSSTYSAVQYSRELHYHNWFNAKPGPIAAPSMPHAYKVRYKDKKKYSSAYSSRVLPK